MPEVVFGTATGVLFNEVSLLLIGEVLLQSLSLV